MRKTMRTRVISILLTLLMVLALVPATAFAAEIQAGTPSITPNIGRSNGTVVGFAGEEWWVIGYNGSGVYSQLNTATLLHKSMHESTDNNIDTYGNTAFRTSDNLDYTTNSSEYANSTLANYLNGNNVLGTFSAKEQALINKRTLTSTDGISGADTENQVLWALSQSEFNEIDDSTVRGYAHFWWLRSSYNFANVRLAYPPGNGMTYDRVEYAGAARPAFNLNLSSVIFTSAASGANVKPTTVGSLSAATAPTGTMKFTMENASQTLNVLATTAQSTQSGGTLTFTYAGATAGTNQYVSCVLTSDSGDGSGSVAYYGKLADSSGAASGDLSIPLTGVLDGTYTLKIFSEEANGDNFTDFCSTPVTMTLTVSGGSGIVSSFGGTVLSNDAGLASVAGETVTAGSEAGTQSAPKTAAVNVANSVTSVALADVVTSNANAEKHIYSANDFTSNADTAISLTEGGATHVYITVTSEDLSSTLYYDVTVNRAPDTTALNAALTNANAIAHGGVNTTQVWTDFVNARTAATNILNQTSPSPTQTEIDTATANLNAAITALKAYDNSSGFENGTGKYTKGSGVNLAHSATRDWSLHTGVVYVDGQRLTHGTHHISAAGSTRTTLLSSYLDTLSVGQHTLTVEFSSGIAPIVDTFEVAAAVTTPAGEGGGSGAPATGDNSNMAVLWVALICAALGMLCLILWRKRERMAADK